MRLMRREIGALGKSAGHWTVGRADSPLLLYILVVSHTYLYTNFRRHPAPSAVIRRSQLSYTTRTVPENTYVARFFFYSVPNL